MTFLMKVIPSLIKLKDDLQLYLKILSVFKKEKFLPFLFIDI